MPEDNLHYLGCDRSDAFVDLTLLAAKYPPQFQRVRARAAELEAYVQTWHQRFPDHQLAVCFEQPAANLIALFSRFAYVILYPLNPATLAAYRTAFVTSGAKDDPADSYWLADLVRTHRDQFAPWQPQSPDLRRLVALVQARRDTVDRLTAVRLQLLALLKSYFPEAIDLIGKDPTAPMALAFLQRWPTLTAVQRAGWPTLERWYRQRRCVRKSALARRRELLATARPLTEDPAVLEPAGMKLELLCAQIVPLTAAIARFDQVIADAFIRHPDHAVFASLPGAGPTFAPRLLAAVGEDRTRFPDAASLQCFSGIAPVVIRSGRSCWVKRRHACPRFVRQSFHEWAGESIRHSRWARAYYQQQKQRGKPHHTIARTLAFKWQRILVRCWHEHTPYSEETYMHSLQHHNPALHQLALTTILPNDKAHKK